MQERAKKNQNGLGEDKERGKQEGQEWENQETHKIRKTNRK
jgi:hypothetical protein